ASLMATTTNQPAAQTSTLPGSAARRPMSPWEAIRQRIVYRFFHWVNLIILFGLSILILAPMIWVVSTSLRTPAQSFSVPPQWIPLHPDFSNYQVVFNKIPFWSQILSSTIVTTSIVLGQLVTASLAGYAFAHLAFPGK